LLAVTGGGGTVANERLSGEVSITHGGEQYCALYWVEDGVLVLYTPWGSLKTRVGGAYAAQAKLLLFEIASGVKPLTVEPKTVWRANEASL
jgi:hypothetical protein